MHHLPPHLPSFHADVFSEVPFPGHPLGIAVDRDTVYVGTHRTATGQPGVPSHIFAYDCHGEVTADFTIQGQAETGQGIAGIALDHDGVLYIVDQAPSRIITLDPRTGEQSLYAELPDVPVCSGMPDGTCTLSKTDRPAQPINLCFDPEGNLYVGDLTQAAIWRVPNGGGNAEVWYTAADLESLFGPNTAHFLDHGKTVLFSQSAHGLLDPDKLATASGRLYTLEVGRDGKPGRRKLFWEGGPGDTPDGFAVGRSGNVYVALAVANTLLVLGPDGREIMRIPTTPENNDNRQVPFDLPGGVAFYGEHLLITNQAFLGGPGAHQVILSIPVHERGKGQFRPRVRRAHSASADRAPTAA